MNRRWLEIIVGLWILVSPWLLGFASISVMKWNNVILGTAIILAALWGLFGEHPEKE